MQTQTLLPAPHLVRVETIVASDAAITLVARTLPPEASCPRCGHATAHVHSRYRRKIADLPWNGIPVRLQVRVRRFFCDQPHCPTHIFVEPLPAVAARYARRTARLAEALHAISYALGGEAGARMALQLGMEVSPDTLLRQVRQPGAGGAVTPRVLGVDDWAMRKGQRYGTILVDLERGVPVVLLPDRRAETLAAWLKEHPGVEIISRDRGGAYADGARAGAPAAVQVADRWHLLKNLAEALEATLAHEQQALRQAASPSGPPPDRTEPPERTPDENTMAASPSPTAGAATRAERDKAQRREQRLARYAEIRQLHQEGYSIRAIAQKTGKSRHTVRHYLLTDAFPEIKRRKRPPGQLEPYAAYLHRRWQAGCHNATQLWRELQEQGYRGSRSTVRQWLSAWRAPRAPGERLPGAPRARVPAPRTVAWWLLRPPEQLTAEQAAFLERLKRSPPGSSWPRA